MGLFDFNDEKNNGIDLLFLVGQMVYPKSSLWQLFDFTAKSTESMWHITSSIVLWAAMRLTQRLAHWKVECTTNWC